MVVSMKDIELRFKAFANGKGYTEKVVGDYYAYAKTRQEKSLQMKMISARNGKIQILETGLGRYEI